MSWLSEVKSYMEPLSSAAKVAVKESKRQILYNALLTAVIVFCTALVTSISTDPACIGLFTFISAALSAIVAFCQAILTVWRRDS